jgi:hypothetical protein
MSANAELELGQSVAERWRDLDERKRSPMASLGKKIVDQKEQMEIWGFLHYDRRDPGATWTRFTPGRRLSGSLCFGEPSHVIHEQLEILHGNHVIMRRTARARSFRASGASSPPILWGNSAKRP